MKLSLRTRREPLTAALAAPGALAPLAGLAALAVLAAACAPVLGAGDGEDFPLVMAKDGSDAEASAIGSPDVIEHGDGYLMVYAQGGAVEGAAPRTNRGRIGLATSADGVSWDRRGTVLSPAASGWDDWFLDTPCVLRVGAVWYLYYFGDADNDAPGAAIGLATSTDLVAWTRSSTEPVLERGAPGAWDANWVESPSVRYDEDAGVFHMWYTGVDESWVVRTGHATSPDGVAWTKDPANPVLGKRNEDDSDFFAWDGVGAGVASAMRLDGTWLLFYASQSLFDTWAGARKPGIGLATSTDGSAFVRYGDEALFAQAETGCQPNGPYNPSALYRDGWFQVWYETGYGFGLVRTRSLERDW